MEALTVQIPENPSKYFLDFSSKEEYLTKRDEWKAIYKWLSKALRHNKKVYKAYLKANAKVQNRMAKKGWTPYPPYQETKTEKWSAGLSEMRDRVKVATSGIPDGIGTVLCLDATKLLEIRKFMKEDSRKQREESLLSKV
jgi:phage pi2 protein 07